MDPAPEYKLCKRGHVQSPENKTNRGDECRLCSRIRAKSHYDYEKKREYDKKYRFVNKEQVFLTQKEYRLKNSEWIKETKRKYHIANKDRLCLKTRKWLQSNIDREKIRKKQFSANLGDLYVSVTLGIQKQIATPELLEIKRLTLQLQRSLKNAN